VKPMDGVEEKQGPHPFIKIVALMTELVELPARGEERVHRSAPATGLQGLVPDGRVRGTNEVD